MRSRHVLTAVGEMEFLRPCICVRNVITDSRLSMPLWTLRRRTCRPACAACWRWLVRGPLHHGRQQMQALAGFAVTTKAVERTAEAIGGHIAQGEHREIQRALQLDLPVVIGKPIPILYVQMDMMPVPVVKKETAGRQGKTQRSTSPHPESQVRMCLHPDYVGPRRLPHLRSRFHHLYRRHQNAENFGKPIYP